MENKDLFERMRICNNCAWKYEKDECVGSEDCMNPELTGFKPNWIWELIETDAIAIITDINGNKKDFKHYKFSIEKIKT